MKIKIRENNKPHHKIIREKERGNKMTRRRFSNTHSQETETRFTKMKP